VPSCRLPILYHCMLHVVPHGRVAMCAARESPRRRSPQRSILSARSACPVHASTMIRSIELNGTHGLDVAFEHGLCRKPVFRFLGSRPDASCERAAMLRYRQDGDADAENGTPASTSRRNFTQMRVYFFAAAQVLFGFIRRWPRLDGQARLRRCEGRDRTRIVGEPSGRRGRGIMNCRRRQCGSVSCCRSFSCWLSLQC
jgi:hypothetical protein